MKTGTEIRNDIANMMSQGLSAEEIATYIIKDRNDQAAKKKSMGKGLQRVAKICGGLTVKAKGKTVKYGADGKPSKRAVNVGSLERVVQLHVAEKPTTGSKWADTMVDEAVNCALIKLKPIIRDELRKEIKRLLTIEEAE